MLGLLLAGTRQKRWQHRLQAGNAAKKKRRRRIFEFLVKGGRKDRCFLIN
jgi:hypothetical protein